MLSLRSLGTDNTKLKSVLTVGSNAAGSNTVTFASDVNISSGNVINMNGSRIRSGAGGIIEFDLPTYDSSNNLIVGTRKVLQFSDSNISSVSRAVTSCNGVEVVVSQSGASNISSGSGGSASTVSSCNLLPNAHGTVDLGTSNVAFRNLYMTGSTYVVGGPSQVTTFTPTDWTYLKQYVINTIAQTAASVTVTKKVFTNSSAQQHSAFLDGSNLYVFGRNTFGQLGLGHTEDRSIPVKVVGVPNAVHVACGNHFTVVVKSDGTAVAAGINTAGQLGDGTTVQKNTFVNVNLPGGFKARRVACGKDFTLFLGYDVDGNGNPIDSTRTIYGFGSCSQGQLGNGATSSVNTSAVLMTLPADPNNGAITIYPANVFCGEFHTVVITTTGAAYVCGWNDSNQLGVDSVTYPNRTTLAIAGTLSGQTLTPFTQVVKAACGQKFTMLLFLDGTIKYTGVMKSGAISSVTWTNIQGTQSGTDAGGSIEMAAGANFAIVSQSTGVLQGMGDNSYQQIQSGAIATYASLTTIGTFSKKALYLGAGERHIMVVLEDNDLYTQGSNEFSQLGVSTGIIMTFRGFLDKVMLQDADLSAGVVLGSSVNASYSVITNADNEMHMTGTNNGQFGVASSELASVTSFIPVEFRSTEFSTVALGQRHTIGLKQDGSVWACGSNDANQLGDGTTTQRTTLIAVSNLSSGVVNIASGGNHNLALRSDGGVWAWGQNGAGQLGDGTVISKSVAVLTSNLTGAITIACGGNFSLALRSDGVVWGWGDNGSGQLGNNTIANQSLPVQMLNLVNVVSISGGFVHTLALRSDGTLWACGAGGNGRLGNNTTVTQSNVVAVSSINNTSNVVSVDGSGDHSLALKSDGTVWAWGAGLAGRLGNNSTVDQSNAVSVSSMNSVASNTIAIACGTGHSMALRSDGTLWTWGDNASGQLGNGNTVSLSNAVQVSGLASIIALGNGCMGSHSIVVNKNGSLTAFGQNTFGQLGITIDQLQTSNVTPTQVLYSQKTCVKQIACGNLHTAILDTYNNVWTIGTNANGQVGNNTSNTATSWFNVRSNVKQIAAGEFFTLALRLDGTISGWGSNSSGQLGTNDTVQKLTPNTMLNISNVIAVSCALNHSLALKSDGTVWGCGFNSNGELGNNTVITQSNIVPISFLNAGGSNTVAIVCGGNHNYALRSTGVVWAWGNNGQGQLCMNDTITRSNAVQTSNLSNVTALTAGFNYGLALISDGTVSAWGQGTFGQLGINNTQNRSNPVTVLGLSNVVGIASGGFHSLALKSDGTIFTWGDNGAGRLGDNSTIQKSNLVPVQYLMNVAYANSNRVNFAEGGLADHMIGFNATSNSLSVFGTNSNGQLGTNDTLSRTFYDSSIIESASNYIKIAGGIEHSVGILSSGKVKGWGANFNGQLGLNNTITFSNAQNIDPTELVISPTNKAIDVACGLRTTYIIRQDGTVVSCGWGARYIGRGIDGVNYSNLAPVSFPVGTGRITQVSAFTYGGIALDENGKVYSWGPTNYPLGTGSTSNVLEPSLINSLSGVTWISAGNNHAAVIANSNLYTWGDGSFGQLGNGLTRAVYPTPVFNLPSPPVRVYCGNNHTVVILRNSAMYTFGDNTQGQLSTLGRLAMPLPLKRASWVYDASANQKGTFYLDFLNSVKVFGAYSTLPKSFTGTMNMATPNMWASGRMGNSHTAFIDNGNVYTCGWNNFGQLGVNDNINRYMPVQVPNLTNITGIACGGFNTLALRSDGTVWAWGYNAQGQLGVNNTINRSNPVQVTGISSVTAITCGLEYTLALRSDGNIWAWGNNGNGQLGVNDTINRSNPVQVTGISSVTAIACGGNHTQALRSDGTVWAWGWNGYGQLGVNNTINRSNPIQVTSISSVTAIAFGDGFSLTLRSDGTVWAWGYNGFGQLGVNDTINRSNPVQVTTISSVTAIACGGYFTLALRSDGTVWAWGANSWGQLGIGSTTQQNSPSQVTSMSNMTAIACGSYHTMAMRNDGTMFSWGLNRYGHLGRLGYGNNRYAIPNDSADDSNMVPIAMQTRIPMWNNGVGLTPSLAAGNSGITPTTFTGTTITGGLRQWMGGRMGENHNAILVNGNVHVWGLNTSSQLGVGDTVDRYLPVQLNNLTGIRAIACGFNHTLAINSDNTLSAWGTNSSGQLGVNDTIRKLSPVQVTSISSVTAIACGESHTFALRSDGNVWACGRGFEGQLGLNDAIVRSNLVQLSSISGITAIACGSFHNLALNSSGNVWAWGNSDWGQLGVNNNIQRSNPVQVPGMSNMTTLACGYNHTVVLRSDGNVWTWGYNVFAQLGTNDTISRSNPVQVTRISNVIAIACGNYYTMALRSDGILWAWGQNENGQIGNGNTNQQNIPVQVTSLVNAIAIACGGNHTLALRNDGTIFSWGQNRHGNLGRSGSNNDNKWIPNGSTSVANSIPIAIPSFDTSGDSVLVSSRPLVVTVTRGNPLGQYINFTGQHRCYVKDKTFGDLPDLEGLIVVTNNDEYVTPDKIGVEAMSTNEALPLVSLATQPSDRTVFGVISLKANEEQRQLDRWQLLAAIAAGDIRAEINAVGEGCIWVCDDNGPIIAGDYITSSSVPGYGMKQNDDYVKNYTVAKITMNCDFTCPMVPKRKLVVDDMGRPVLTDNGMPKFEVIMQAKTELKYFVGGAEVTKEVYDAANGDKHVQTIDVLDESGKVIMEPVLEPKYRSRYLKEDGTVIDKATYDSLKANGEKVFVAAFVGCSYHCG